MFGPINTPSRVKESFTHPVLFVYHYHLPKSICARIEEAKCSLVCATILFCHFCLHLRTTKFLWKKKKPLTKIFTRDLPFLRRKNMSPLCLALCLSHLDLHLCHFSYSRDRNHFTSCSYVSLNPSTYHPVAAVIPPLLRSLCPSTPAFICLAVSPLFSRKLETAGNRQEDGRRERQRSPWGFLTLFLSLTLSHQISISLLLMRLLDPSSSLFLSLSVPLNLSLFLFARFVSAHSFHTAHYLTQPHPSLPQSPSVSPAH